MSRLVGMALKLKLDRYILPRLSSCKINPKLKAENSCQGKFIIQLYNASTKMIRSISFPSLKYLFQLFLLPQMSSWIILQCLLRCVICFLIARVYANLEDMISNQDSSIQLHCLINSRCLGFLNMSGFQFFLFCCYADINSLTH